MSEEQTLFNGPSSGIVNLWSYLFGGIVLAGAAAAAIMFSVWFSILAACALIYIAIRSIANRFRIYELTSERIRLKTGILTRRTEEIELYRVQDITLVEPLLERLLGIGTIQIITGDESTPHLSLQSIRGAAQLREDLRKCVETCREQKRVRIAEVEGQDLP